MLYYSVRELQRFIDGVPSPTKTEARSLGTISKNTLYFYKFSNVKYKEEDEEICEYWCYVLEYKNGDYYPYTVPKVWDAIAQKPGASDTKLDYSLIATHYKSIAGDFSYSWSSSPPTLERKIEMINAFVVLLYCFVYVTVGKPVSNIEHIIESVRDDALDFIGIFFSQMSVSNMIDKLLDTGKLDIAEFLSMYSKKMSSRLKHVPEYIKFKALKSVIVQAISFLNTPSFEKNAWKNLVKNVGLTNQPDLYEPFYSEYEKIDFLPLQKQYLKLLRKVTGSNDLPSPPHLSANDINILKSRKPEGSSSAPDASGAYKYEIDAYKFLYSTLSKITTAEILRFVRRSGKKMVPTKDVYAYFKEKGMIPIMPIGFQGNIDSNGRYYTVAGKTTPGLPMGSLAIGNYTMNKDYSPDTDDCYVCTYTSLLTSVPPMKYTETHNKKSTTAKFLTVEEFVNNLQTLSNKWRVEMRNTHNENFMQALMVELVYWTCARIGTRIGTTLEDGTPTFGISTVLGKHVTVTDKKITIVYSGKKGMIQTHVIRPNTRYLAKIFSYITVRKQYCGREGFVFINDVRSIKNPNAKRCDPDRVNAYLKDIGSPSDFGVHKLRAVRGTQLFESEVEENRYLSAPRVSLFKECGGRSSKVSTIVNTEVGNITKKVGESLGHYSTTKSDDKTQVVVGTTALSYYISPVSIERVYKKFDVSPSASIQAIIDKMSKE